MGDKAKALLERVWFEMNHHMGCQFAYLSAQFLPIEKPFNVFRGIRLNTSLIRKTYLKRRIDVTV